MREVIVDLALSVWERFDSNNDNDSNNDRYTNSNNDKISTIKYNNDNIVILLEILKIQCNYRE